MRDLLYSKKPVIKSTIGDVKITIQFSNQETQGLRESIVSALTVSYEQRIQGQLSQLLASLEPEQTFMSTTARLNEIRAVIHEMLLHVCIDSMVAIQ